MLILLLVALNATYLEAPASFSIIIVATNFLLHIQAPEAPRICGM